MKINLNGLIIPRYIKVIEPPYGSTRSICILSEFERVYLTWNMYAEKFNIIWYKLDEKSLKQFYNYEVIYNEPT